MLNGLLLTALPLDDQQKRVIEDHFADLYAQSVSLTCQVDESLLGGVRVELCGRIYDGSLKGQLAGVLRTFTSGEGGATDV